MFIFFIARKPEEKGLVIIEPEFLLRKVVYVITTLERPIKQSKQIQVHPNFVI